MSDLQLVVARGGQGIAAWKRATPQGPVIELAVAAPRDAFRPPTAVAHVDAVDLALAADVDSRLAFAFTERVGTRIRLWVRAQSRQGLFDPPEIVADDLPTDFSLGGLAYHDGASYLAWRQGGRIHLGVFRAGSRGDVHRVSASGASVPSLTMSYSGAGAVWWERAVGTDSSVAEVLTIRATGELRPPLTLRPAAEGVAAAPSVEISNGALNVAWVGSGPGGRGVWFAHQG
jgi:hypothetical protein